MKKEECKKKILEMLNGRDLAEQLAEESAELAQAAIKTIRAAGYTRNKTPVTREEAAKDLLEEMTDVVILLDLIVDIERLVAFNELNPKWERWVKRLEESDG